MHPTNSHFFSK